MDDFDSLTLALADWFSTDLLSIPEPLRQRVEQEFLPMPWDALSEEQRRSVALQVDYQRDPENEDERKFWWDFFERMDGLKKQVAEWQAASATTATELAMRETKLTELEQELAGMETRSRLARCNYQPHMRPALGQGHVSEVASIDAPQYIPYPKAIQLLTERIGASPEELAAWIWDGPQDGGIAAYLNPIELNPPRRFYYATCNDDQDYVAPLMACWFATTDINEFEPSNRYMLGSKLIERWNKRAGLQAHAFIQAKIKESRLLDIHPITGGTSATFPDRSGLPSVETGLFVVSQVERIEAEDFCASSEPEEVATPDLVNPSDSIDPPKDISVGSPAWRKETAKAAANAKHDRPGGSREKKQQIRDLWSSGKYSSKNICAEEECAALGMSFSAARRALTKEPVPRRC